MHTYKKRYFFRPLRTVRMVAINQNIRRNRIYGGAVNQPINNNYFGFLQNTDFLSRNSNTFNIFCISFNILRFLSDIFSLVPFLCFGLLPFLDNIYSPIVPSFCIFCLFLYKIISSNPSSFLSLGSKSAFYAGYVHLIPYFVSIIFWKLRKNAIISKDDFDIIDNRKNFRI